MAYKLIAIDLDDTLLDSKKRISSQNIDVLKQVMAAGVRVILASGRNYQSVQPYLSELGIEDYTIVLAGGEVVDSKKKAVHSTYLPPVAAKQIMRWAALRDIHFQVYLDDGFHYLKQNRFLDFYEAQCGCKGTHNPDLLNMEPLLAPKILFVDDTDKIQEYRSEVESVFPEIKIQISQPEYLEFFNPDASKGEALSFVAKQLGIGPEQIMAIGDSEIDASMLEYAGLGIAVANAIPSVLDIADYVTDSCEESGVAKVIEKYIPL